MVRTWILENRCGEGCYRINWNYIILPNLHNLEGKVETIVANPLHIKAFHVERMMTSIRKWIAEVCLNGQIKPSYIPCREIRDGVRELTRTHVKFTQSRTVLKNKVHKILQRSGVRISGVLSDIFGNQALPF